MAPVSKTVPAGGISQAAYLLARMFAGCEALQEEGGWLDGDETFVEAIDFGERLILRQERDINGQLRELAMREQMPVVVISTNASYSAATGGCEFIESGILAAHVYLAQSQEAGSVWHGANFFGALQSQLAEQTKQLSAPGDLWSDLVLPVKRIELIGPTRTPISERGRDGHNDYHDGVFMVHWDPD